MATARRMRSAPAAQRGQQQRSTEEVGRGRVTTEAKDRDGPYHSSDREDTILTRRFAADEHPAYVKFSAGLTISLGQGSFEFLRIDSSVSLPCLPSEIDETHMIAADWVADRIAEEETNWLGQNTKTKAKRG